MFIPFDLLLSDKKRRLLPCVRVMLEKSTGADIKTIKRYLDGKPQHQKKKESIIKGFEKLGIEFSNGMLKNKELRYSSNIETKARDLCAILFEILRNNYDYKDENAIFSFADILFFLDFHDDLFESDIVNLSCMDAVLYKSSSFEGALRVFAFDLVLYRIAAFDVEFSNNNIGSNKAKPIAFYVLPFIEHDSIFHSVELWFQNLKRFIGVESDVDFIAILPQLLSDKVKEDRVIKKQSDPDPFESKRRQWQYWKSGKIPTWENVNKIVDTIARRKYSNEKIDDIAFFKNVARIQFAFAKVFNSILFDMLKLPNKKELALSPFKTVDFFERYLKWHNYHVYEYGQWAKQNMVMNGV